MKLRVMLEQEILQQDLLPEALPLARLFLPELSGCPPEGRIEILPVSPDMA